ncbi:MAG TPA: 3-isopropylmalate dehydratase small subunit [Verrucomicrobiales bacterium]|jgi:3-isopropylmalate/(R)-2-methylmalate dehydratase small subunit|nr:3-isopropylmalate dehydratase small subunit [Verrucomicrobiales bacterium]
MALEKITQVSGTAVYVPGSDIDTDRIIPARFMKCITFDGLGEYLFYDVRKNADGTDREHPLNDPRFKGASILLSGVNFGCGSSREHAPQAIYRYGFRAVVAESFAEIFFGNCTTLGIPCAVAAAADMKRLREAVEKDPQITVTVDVEKNRVFFGSENFTVNIADTARDALTSGRWDPIADLLEGESAVAATAGGLDYMKR